MKIAIDVSPLKNDNKIRGVGFYLEHLKNSLVKYFPENEYVFFERGEKLPEKIDLVHFPYFEPFFLALPLYKRYKTVVTVHDLTPLVFPDNFPKGLKGQLKWQMQRFSLKQTKGIITDSECSKNDIIRLVGVKEKMIDVVHLAAGEEFKKLEIGPADSFQTGSRTNEIRRENWKQEIKRKYNLPDSFVLYVGDVTWNKNLPRLIDAIKTTDISLVMIGKSLVNENYDKTNPWNHDLVRVQELSNDDKQIIRLGFIETEDLVSIYNIATAFVMPSLYEGFGLPILEAMACGCPVITTKEGSLKEVAGNAAQFVDGYDLNSIAKGIGDVFESKVLQDDLREKGFTNVAKYSWKLTAQKTIEAYKKAIE